MKSKKNFLRKAGATNSSPQQDRTQLSDLLCRQTQMISPLLKLTAAADPMQILPAFVQQVFIFVDAATLLSPYNTHLHCCPHWTPWTKLATNAALCRCTNTRCQHRPQQLTSDIMCTLEASLSSGVCACHQLPLQHCTPQGGGTWLPVSR